MTGGFIKPTAYQNGMDWTLFGYGIGSGFLLGAIGVMVFLFKTNIVQNWLFSQIVDVFEQLPAILKAKPEIIQNLLEPLLAELGKAGGGGQPRDLNLGGFKIPAWVVSMGMQMLGGAAQKQSGNGAAQTLISGAKDILGR